MADQRIGVGIIGTGGISRTHIAGLLSQSGDIARIVAVADISEERGHQAARAAGGADYHADYRALLARDDIQLSATKNSGVPPAACRDHRG